jgi:UDP-glucuronate decarboxylase
VEQNPILKADFEAIANADLPWEKMEGKTVLITGANGLLPSYIAKSLLYRNMLRKGNKPIKVLGLVRNIEKANKVFANYLTDANFTLIDNSILQPLKIEGAVDFIIHAASQASPKYYGIDPVGTAEPNVIGTYHLLNLAKEKKAQKFLFFSTSEVYGTTEGIDTIHEDDLGKVNPTAVRSCYSESKRMGENLCASFAHQFDIDTSIVRPFHTYGPGLSFDDGRVFADFVANIVRNEDISMNSDGSAIRSFCYIKDATEGFLTVLLKGEKGDAYNIANPDGELSIRALAETLTALFPEKGLKARFVENKDKNYIASTFKKLTPSIEKAKKLGWQPTTSVEEGFRKTILSYQ